MLERSERADIHAEECLDVRLEASGALLHSDSIFEGINTNNVEA
jgi:hypothetical protein